MSAGTAVGTNPEAAWGQTNIVKHNDDPLGRNVKVSTQLQHAPAGQIHVGLGLEQKKLSALVGTLTVKPLEFALIHLTAQPGSQYIQRPKAAVMFGSLVFLTRIA